MGTKVLTEGKQQGGGSSTSACPCAKHAGGKKRKGAVSLPRTGKAGKWSSSASRSGPSAIHRRVKPKHTCQMHLWIKRRSKKKKEILRKKPSRSEAQGKKSGLSRVAKNAGEVWVLPHRRREGEGRPEGPPSKTETALLYGKKKKRSNLR